MYISTKTINSCVVILFSLHVPFFCIFPCKQGLFEPQGKVQNLQGCGGYQDNPGNPHQSLTGSLKKKKKKGNETKRKEIKKKKEKQLLLSFCCVDLGVCSSVHASFSSFSSNNKEINQTQSLEFNRKILEFWFCPSLHV